MLEGLALFEALAAREIEMIELFPTASRTGPTDQHDAIAAAVTARHARAV